MLRVPATFFVNMKEYTLGHNKEALQPSEKDLQVHSKPFVLDATKHGTSMIALNNAPC